MRKNTGICAEIRTVYCQSLSEDFVIHVVMASCETVKPCAYIPLVPMTLDLQRELLLLAQAKARPS